MTESRSQVPWRALAFAVIAVAVGLGAGFLMLRLADSGGVDVRLGDAEFSAGSAESRSDDIAEGGPLLFADPNSDRDIFVQHLGEDTNRGWLVFETRWPGSPSSCSLKWEVASRQFVPPDSEECRGLPRAEEDGTAVIVAADASGSTAMSDAPQPGGEAGGTDSLLGSSDLETSAAFTRLPQHRIEVTPGGQLIVTLLANRTDE